MRYRYYQPAGPRNFFDVEFDQIHAIPFQLVYEDTCDRTPAEETLEHLFALHNAGDRPRRFEIRSMSSGDLLLLHDDLGQNHLFQAQRTGGFAQVSVVDARLRDPASFDLRHLSDRLLADHIRAATSDVLDHDRSSDSLAAGYAELRRRREVANFRRPVAPETQARIAEQWTDTIRAALNADDRFRRHSPSGTLVSLKPAEMHALVGSV